ncbi:Mce associated membrane protein [Mycobacterium sp. MFM001]|uniref:mammalian cell entry protein n=1 Tax=Mycobacterium sp. MFM001 TaxID=2049453 RepID=UPI000DA543E7|nr:mammalian cell entry protein [Mycobacterium sp. MFM001]GBE63772.1 Mce associated membrane protein [Mycobacterium sp. MFM001]
MEDQQPATGDLTEAEQPARKRRWWPSRARNKSAAAPAEAVEAASDEPETAEEQPEASESPAEDAVESDTDTAESSESDEAPEPAETVVDEAQDAEETEADAGRKPVGRRLAIAVAVAAVLFVGSAAFAGAMVQPYVKDRATVVTKLRIASTAANAITTLWTYNPDNMDKLADRAAQYLSGDFEAQYRKYIDAIVAPNKQAQITNTTEVTGAAVESLNANDATAIVYTNTTSTSPLSKNVPALRYLSYRLTMKRDHARWLVTKMTTITSLDLTPQM